MPCRQITGSSCFVRLLNRQRLCSVKSGVVLYGNCAQKFDRISMSDFFDTDSRMLGCEGCTGKTSIDGAYLACIFHEGGCVCHEFAKRINLIGRLSGIVAQGQFAPIHFQEKSAVTA
jgi:hypothetical protein